LALAGCRPENDDNAESPILIRQAVPEFIFQVDYGAPGAGQDFWFEWTEPTKVSDSSRTIRPLFDKEETTVSLQTCPSWREHKKKNCPDKRPKLKFVDRQPVTNTPIPAVLRDGVQAYSNVELAFEDLPRGAYRLDLLFHDAASAGLGGVRVELEVDGNVVDLGSVEVSKGEDASQPSTISYEFNLLAAKPVVIKFVCLYNGFILNGFELSKYFGEPTGPEPGGETPGGDPGQNPQDRFGFAPPERWSPDFGRQGVGPFENSPGWDRYGIHPRQLADVNGDGRADLVGFADYGVYVGLSTGRGFQAAELWLADFARITGSYGTQERQPRQLADVNGDGLADVVGFSPTGVEVALSNGQQFLPKELWSLDFGRDDKWVRYSLHPRWLADVNGDGRADILAAKNQGVWQALATENGFGEPELVINDFALAVADEGFAEFNWADYNHFPRHVLDVDGDGLADIAGFAKDGLWVALRSGDGFAGKRLVNRFFKVPNGWDYFQNMPQLLGNLGGRVDQADAIGFQQDRVVLVLDVLQRNTWFELPVLSDYVRQRKEFHNYEYAESPIHMADVNGDGRDDVVLFLTDGTHVAVNIADQVK
jgi:hypothetical protein